MAAIGRCGVDSCPKRKVAHGVGRNFNLGRSRLVQSLLMSLRMVSRRQLLLLP